MLRRFGKRLAPWLGAVAWERDSTGDMGACRRLFVRAIREVEDYPDVRVCCMKVFARVFTRHLRPRIMAGIGSVHCRGSNCTYVEKKYGLLHFFFFRTERMN